MSTWKGWIVVIVLIIGGLCRVYLEYEWWQMDAARKAEHPCTHFTPGGWCKYDEEVR